MLNIGDMLDNTYEIKEKIGAGGGGVVYRAYHTRLKKDVVVKLIRDSVKEKLDSRAEADILKNLKHTYLPQVTDFIESDGNVYTVMDFIPGKSFSQELKSGTRFTQKQVIKWAGQLCEAVEYLHKQKPAIIHSDIKPANVMLTPDGDICLIDFNISQFFDGTNGVVIGRTNGYAPPEQYKTAEKLKQTADIQAVPQNMDIPCNSTDNNATEIDDDSTDKTIVSFDADKTEVSATANTAAKSSKVTNGEWFTLDERSDIYALGATLYHILTGIKPNTSIYGVKPLRQIYPNITDGLEFIISKAMEIDPNKRFSSASEMLKALRNIFKLDKTYRRHQHKQDLLAFSLVFLFTAFAVMAITGWRTMGQERSDKYYTITQSVQEMMQNGNVENAMADVTKALEMYPERVDAYYLTALGYFTTGDYTGTVDFVNGIETTSFEMVTPADYVKAADLEFICANAYFEMEQYEQAVEKYRNAVVKNAENSEYYRDYAISLVRNGDILTAEKVLETAVAKGLDSASILLVQGEIAVVEGDYATAQKAFNSVIDDSETDDYLKERAYIICAKTYKEQNDVLGETVLLEKAVNTLPQKNTMLITEMLGEGYSAMAQQNPAATVEYTKKAIMCFQNLIERGYTRFYILQNMAILYQNIGDYTLAQETLTKMEQEYPADYHTFMQRAFLQADMQNLLPNEQRSYNEFYNSYKKAVKLYDESKNVGNDTQMLMLEDLMLEIQAGGWFD